MSSYPKARWDQFVHSLLAVGALLAVVLLVPTAVTAGTLILDDWTSSAPTLWSTSSSGNTLQGSLQQTITTPWYGASETITFTANIDASSTATTIKAVSSGFDAYNVTNGFFGGNGLTYEIDLLNNSNQVVRTIIAPNQFSGSPLPSSLDPNPNNSVSIPSSAKKVQVVFILNDGGGFLSQTSISNNTQPSSPFRIAFTGS